MCVSAVYTCTCYDTRCVHARTQQDEIIALLLNLTDCLHTHAVLNILASCCTQVEERELSGRSRLLQYSVTLSRIRGRRGKEAFNDLTCLFLLLRLELLQGLFLLTFYGPANSTLASKLLILSSRFSSRFPGVTFLFHTFPLPDLVTTAASSNNSNDGAGVYTHTQRESFLSYVRVTKRETRRERAADWIRLQTQPASHIVVDSAAGVNSRADAFNHTLTYTHKPSQSLQSGISSNTLVVVFFSQPDHHCSRSSLSSSFFFFLSPHSRNNNMLIMD